jgi:hypothetical protein
VEVIMLRTLGRATVIVVLAGLVAGALYLAVGRQGPAADRRVVGTDADSFDRDWGHGRERGHRGSVARGEHGGRHEASLGRGVAGVAVTALQIGCLGAVVVGLQKGWRRRRSGPGQRP